MKLNEGSAGSGKFPEWPTLAGRSTKRQEPTSYPPLTYEMWDGYPTSCHRPADSNTTRHLD